MAKPTLLQSVLGRPSQTYSFPPEKADYYSTKSQMLRIAAEQEVPSQVSTEPDDDDSDQDVFYTPRTSFMSTATSPAPDSSSASTYSSISSLFDDINSVSTNPTTRSATSSDQYFVTSPTLKHRPEPLFIPVRKASHFAKTKSMCTPSIMTSMTALLEEDEGAAMAEHRTHPPKSNVLISSPHPLRAASTSHNEKERERMSPTTPSPLIRSSSTSSTTSPRLTNPKPSTSTLPSPHPQPRHQRSRSLTYPKTTALPASTSSYSPSLPSHGTPGYTSLILPRAPPTSIGVAKAPGTGIGEEGKVDLTRSGVAQTTMASIEIVKGLGEERVGKMFGFGGLFGRRRTIGGNRKGAHADERWSSNTGPLGFTSYRAPPSYVPAGSVLVQVWAVGVDGIDERLVSGKAGQGGMAKGKGKLEVGYIPGRSFVGRVLECGWEVKEEVARKGEWVAGLLDARKCGALAEFIVTDRRRVHRVPHPCMSAPRPIHCSSSSPDSPPPDRTPSIPLSSSTQSHTNESLTLEELALLPLCGVPAYRAVRTFSVAPSFPSGASAIPASSSNHTSSSRHVQFKGRALVLRGHNGAGAVAVQILVLQGWRVCVHAPGPGDGDGELEREYMRELEERIGAWGGEEVLFDDGDADADRAAVRVVENLADEGEVFDAVLDTVGGKDVWGAGERLLKVGVGNTKRRQFTTLVGDAPARAIPSAGDNFKAGLRLLRLGDVGRSKDRDWKDASDDGGAGGEDGNDKVKANAKVGYAWVSVTQDVDWEGKDVRDSVGVVLEMAMNGVVKPLLESVVPFERTPDVFGELGPEKDPLAHGGTVVVRVVG